ncbi:FAD-dependent monooxygenase [Legionella fairfieldensis]|uniref:FAD-dependent monooxygenase n=1 Tax=Legionella fairfieldensis TaxID=45064 RepID=UPI0004912961|nr:FAD-dependent monooxygenase [Legionella fairfieldensis]
MNQYFDVAVIGGGVVGLCAAVAMAQRGFSVAIIDAGTLQVDLTKQDPRVYAINQASQDLLLDLGVWQQLDKTRTSPYRHMYVWDAANGAHIEFDSRLIAGSNLGVIVEESALKQVLLQKLNLEKVVFFPRSLITTFETNADFIQVNSDKKSWQAKLVMVADGANSPCRQLLNVPLTSWPYHQQALVASVRTEKAHQQTAYQVFNADGPLAFLPLNGDKQCSIVWSTSPTHANQLMTLSDEEFNRELTEAFASKLGQVWVQGKRYQFPLTMRHVNQYSGKRWLLLGDAAHTIHPLAGLGLNVGLADVSVWLDCLAKSKNCLTSSTALSAYQRQRKQAVWQIIATMEALKTLFLNPLPPVVTLRNLGLRVCNRFSPLKRVFIEHAIGKKLSML